MSEFSISGRLFKANASGCRYVIHQGGTGSGKTFAALQYLFFTALGNQNLTISVVAETLPHLKRGAMRDFKRIVSMLGMDSAVTENKTDHTFKIGTSLIEFFSADAEAKLRGARRDILFINECNNIDYEAFQQLDVRTRRQTILDFNPVRRFWVHDQLMPMLRATDSTGLPNPSIGGAFAESESNKSSLPPLEGGEAACEALFIKSTYLDNDHLSPQEKQNIERRRTNLNWWKVYGEGEIGMAEGVVFSNWTIIGPTPALPIVEGEGESVPDTTTQSFSPMGGPRGAVGNLLGYGIDFGFTHSPTALVQIHECNGELYIHELLYRTGMQNDELFAFAQKHIDLRALTVADSAEPKTIDYLYRKGWHGLKAATKGSDSVEFGINLLLDRKLNITAESVNLIKELRQYMWDTNKDGHYIRRPIKDFDHAIDAIRYVVTYPKKRRLVFA